MLPEDTYFNVFIWFVGAVWRRARSSPQADRTRRRVLVLSAVGKSAGTFCVTLPVAAHSVPRWYVAMKPTQFSAARSWPIAVWKTRPLP